MHEIGLGRVFSYLCGWIDRMWRRWSAHASKNGRREINAANLVGVFGLGGLGRFASDVLFHLLDGPK